MLDDPANEFIVFDKGNNVPVCVFLHTGGHWTTALRGNRLGHAFQV